MFESLEEFNNWIKIAKDMDDQIIADAYKFIERFPNAPFSDAVKAMRSLLQGKSLDKLISSYAVYQTSLGAEDAVQDYKKVLTMSDVLPDMLYDLEHGKEKGTSTYIAGTRAGEKWSLDEAWTWRMGEFNIWTGYSNEGKSTFLRFLALIKAIKEKWRFAFYVPEDYPAKEFFDDIIHTASGYSTDRDHPNHINKKLYLEVYEQIKDYFFFVYLKPPENTLMSVLKEFIPLIKNEDVKGCIIDPFIKLSRSKAYINADDKLAGYVTTMCTDFSREFHVSLHLVMHQLTPRLQENGLYPKPSMYYIKGGGTWADGSDNVLFVQRPKFAKDKIDDETTFGSQKIKKPKLVGLPQEIPLRFNRRTNRFIDFESKRDVFNFDKALHLPKITLL